ncbi:hypothetical protein F8G81_20145 [Arthrobacter sp. CDRTa11]|uniref:hypothetical protein n=1 Tax=Arthrobacter sp. CDRTa11 TaxID=2651199 RepID=UPI002265AD80|nr:hypothetical protein [Arthrobacter sp. CDRTa11]UZX04650.1 hypothetical protein F8G81_20145 [Arthrobacter sp. CDRTa11]
MKKRIPVTEKLARRVMNLSVPLHQSTGTHCELSGIWQSPTGVRIQLFEGQLLPADAGRPCHWTHVGFHEARPGSRQVRWAVPEPHLL